MGYLVIDTTKIVHEFLTQGGNPLSASVGNRVWSPIAHSKWNNTTTAIVFHEESGGANQSGAAVKSVFAFKCFGGTNSYVDAQAVFGLLYDRLQSARARLMSGTIMVSRMITHSNLPPEQDTKFKSHLVKFQIEFEV